LQFSALSAVKNIAELRHDRSAVIQEFANSKIKIPADVAVLHGM